MFNKKLLNNIEKVKRDTTGHLYDNKSKIHYFPFTESNLFSVISCFKNSNFSIHPELILYYDKIPPKMILEQAQSFVVSSCFVIRQAPCL